LGAGGSFLARTYDKDMKHMEKIVKAAHLHKGTSLVEVLQNCVIFNDNVFEPVVAKENRADTMIFVEHGQKLIFGKENEKGIQLNHGTFNIVSAVDNPDQVAVFDAGDPHFMQTFESVGGKNGIPVPFGVLYKEDRAIYEDDLEAQVAAVTAKKGRGNLRQLLHAGETWEVA
jgi:2-oxoglutarate/2-oxoacid ferredoxin oxidoreductase subunit beta